MKLIDLLHENKVQGTYGAVNFSPKSLKNIIAFCERNKIPNIESPEDMHCTVIYSTTPVPDFNPKATIKEYATPKTIEIWDVGTDDEPRYCLVLRIESEYMHQRFNDAMALGATYDYATYKPHITLSYNVGHDFKLGDINDSVKSIDLIEIVNEYVTGLDD